MRRILVFDVNETLLDLQALDVHFIDLFGTASARAEWFGQVLRSALVATLTDAYADFGVVGRAALAMTAARRGRALAEADYDRVLGAMRELPPHPDVVPALTQLRAAGFRMVALTNSPPAAAEAQVTHAGLRGFLEAVYSVDAVRRFKPAPEPYRYAAEQLGTRTSGLRMVAAHAWDVTGAMRAGCAAAFVARPGMVLGPLSEHPDVIGPDLIDVAGKIIAAEPG